MPRLTSEEVDELLRREGLVRVATTGKDGFPTLVPVAFLYRDRSIPLLAGREPNTFPLLKIFLCWNGPCPRTCPFRCSRKGEVRRGAWLPQGNLQGRPSSDVGDARPARQMHGQARPRALC